MVRNTFSRYPLYLSQVVVIGGRGQTLGITVIGCHKAWHTTQLQYHINTELLAEMIHWDEVIIIPVILNFAFQL